jgi:PAS domain S-box-containing protein
MKTGSRIEDLLEHEELTRFLENAAIALHWVGANGTILWANRAELKLLGYTQEEYIGHNITEFHVDAPAITDILSRLKRGEELREYQARLRAKDGSVRYVSIISNVYSKDGRFVHTRCFTRDITEQRRTAELQERLAAIVDSSDDAIISKDLNGIIRSWNRGAERIFGYSAEEIVGKPVATLAVPERVDEIPNIIDRIRRGEHVDHYETKRQTKDGRVLTVSLSVSPIRDASGRIIGASKVARDITEQKRSEEALRASEQYLQTVLDSMPECVKVLDPDGTVLRMNRAGLAIVEADAPAQVIGTCVYPIVNEPDREAFQELNESVFHGSRGGTVEFTITGLKGSQRTLETNVVPLRNPDDEVTGALSVTRDITQRKRAQAQDAFLVQLDDATRPVTDPQEITETAARLLGEYLDVDRCAYAEVDDQKGVFNLTGNYTRGVPSIVGRYELADFGDEFMRLMRAGEPYVVEDAESDPRAVDVRAVYRQTNIRAVISVPLYKGDRFVAGMAVHQKSRRRWRPEDVELLRLVANRCWESIERTRIERELRAREEEFRTLANTIPNLAWMAQPDGSIFWYNRRWYDYTGTTPEEMQGWGWQRVHSPDKLPAVLERWKQSITSGEPFEMVFPLRGADGTFRSFLTRVEPVKDAQGRVGRWFGTNTDIAAQQETQEALERSNQELRRVNEDLNQFAYSASHDLQEPLRMVSIYSELLRRKFERKLGRQGDEYIRYTVQGALRMEELVRDLLAYTQASNVAAEPSTIIDANQALDKALTGLQASLERSDAKIIGGALPAVRMHEVHLEQLFQNLIGNAIKYRGPESPRIEVTAERRPREWLFSVKDNGIGIDQKYREQIFGIFKRLHTADAYSGTGIGLAICERIVERAGGRIWVESQLGQGSTFFFTIPDEEGAWYAPLS